jgi:hypothetical protein
MICFRLLEPLAAALLELAPPLEEAAPPDDEGTFSVLRRHKIQGSKSKHNHEDMRLKISYNNTTCTKNHKRSRNHAKEIKPGAL